MVVTALGIVTLVNDTQLEKVASLMLVSLLGSWMLLRLVQLAKAASPMWVILFEKPTVVSLLQ